MDNNIKFIPTFNYKCIYIFRINDKDHEGKLKIGDATVHSEKTAKELFENCEELKIASKDRINQYTQTAGIKYELLHTEIAVTNTGRAFRDYEVHDVLTRSGIDRFYFDTNNKQNEWFIVDLETAKKSIKAVKEGKKALGSNEITKGRSPIVFRPEQQEAIEFTRKRFKSTDSVLWNAKMRFGKTLTALEVVKEEQFKRTIIITHRPVVKKSWFEDFNKLFYDKPEYQYGSKTYGEPLTKLLEDNTPFVYFASIQDLRGSNIVGGKFEKNDLVFNVDWDLVVIDEAHEGTKTGLGERTIEGVVKIRDGYPTKVLNLTGTAFNLISDFEQEDVYTWDYVMEQSAKYTWEESEEHFGDSNPYEDLPQLNIYTYYLDEFLPKYIVDVSDKSFNFKEFFRTWTGEPDIDRKTMPNDSKVGDFVHEKDVESFVNLLIKTDDNSNYPFSTDEYRNYFRHSLWMLPGVKEAKALSKLLNKHPVFGSGQFKIVNVAGDGDEEIDSSDALKAVQDAITESPEKTYTITLSCGRLTTGVTVRPWTAVLMLSGSFNTSASSYLQTIFRVQSPANIGGKIKEKCYVFDFAPDRTLNMMAQAGQLSTKVGSIEPPNILMKKLLNFCPVIGLNGSQMVKYNVNNMLQQLKKAVAQRVVSNGFDDPKIYNDNLLKLTDIELKEFDKLKEIIGASKPSKKIEQIDINKQGLTNEEYEKIEIIKEKNKRELTEEEKALLEQLKEQKKQRNTAISILRGISIRIPLLIYGADIDIQEDVTIDNFTELVDENSWKEFMPKGVTKEKFNEFSKYYDNEVFVEAGRQIRKRAKYADSLSTKERIQEISQIFGMFRNPDKETVLTPWKVVNMHLGDCTGGYNFNKDDNNPYYINAGDVSNDIYNNTSVKLLEIYSKTGLYALYVAYSMYMNRLINYNKEDFKDKTEDYFWKETIEKNLFILCGTKMAKQIVKRTLCGYKEGITPNIIVIDNFLEKLIDDYDNEIKRIKNPQNWKLKGETMNFDAVIGNPPYQLKGGSGGNNDALIFQHFANAAADLGKPYVSLVIPSRWFSAGRENLIGDFRKKMINNESLQKLIVFPNSSEVFSNVEIKGGICYYLINKNYKGLCDYTLVKDGQKNNYNRKLNDFELLIRDPMISEIAKKVMEKCKNKAMMDSIISNDTPFGIGSNPKNGKKYNFDFKETKSTEYNVELHYIENQKRKKGYVKKKDIKKNTDFIPNIKVLIPGSAWSGDDPYVMGETIITNNNSVCSQSYLFIPSNTKEEAENIVKYIKTKFFRILVKALKITQSGPNRVYQLVPIQDFSDNSDIKWNASESEIDKQLYQKYELSNNQINYIENTIKEI